jgi:antirestriction protein
MKTKNTDARIYCGTYAKYNGGSIAGAWLTLADYSSREEFLEACRELHSDERDPELMFQDYEGFPRCWYFESQAPPEMLWEFLELDEEDAEAFAAYADNIRQGATVQGFRDAYIGKWESGADYAQESTDGRLPELPAWLVIDWAATWDCNLRHDYFTADAPDGGVFIFSNH